MQKNLEDLIKDYKKSLNVKILEKIFVILNPSLQKKAKYIFWRYKNTHLIEYNDILQEARLLVIESIKRYDSKKGTFKNYFNQTIWNWIPDILREKQFLQSLNTESDISTNDEGEEYSKFDKAIEFDVKEDNSNLDEKLNKLTFLEKMIVNILRKNPSTKQSELADMYRVSKQRINQIFNTIRIKLK